ncbi:MAG: molybdopterin molybdotransferase MoeA [Bacteroidota bacterium]
MISSEDATKIVLENTLQLTTERVPLAHALGRLLAEDLIADRDFPPYDRVAMDGIAIQYTAFAKGQRQFPVEGVAAAGSPQKVLQSAESCMEIMTGAVLCKGADTIIRYEDVSIEDGIATITVEEIKQGQNVHNKGLDRKAGSIIISKGNTITPAEIGVAATVGKPELVVKALPSVVILSSGDELVEINQTPLPHQIRKSNVYSIQAILQGWGIAADTAHLIDDQVQIEQQLQELVANYDILVMSGGVSKGKYDFIPAALEKVGIQKLFHRVRQRPGKPFWFGKGERGTVVFALPGNPVSSFMCTMRYLQAFLRKSQGLAPFAEKHAILTENVLFKPDLTYFMQVKLSYTKEGTLLASPTHGYGSGDLANLTQTDAFMELPTGQQEFKKGSIYPIFPYR